jgi:hypothetical protein
LENRHFEDVMDVKEIGCEKWRRMEMAQALCPKASCFISAVEHSGSAARYLVTSI